MKIRAYAFTCLTGMLFTLAVGLAPTRTQAGDALEKPALTPSSIATVQSSYGKLPLSFEANHGQWEAPVQFVTRGQGHTLFVTPNQAVLSVRTGEATAQERVGDLVQQKSMNKPAPLSQSVVHMHFAGADPAAEVVGLEPLPGIVNYFIGNDPAKWHTNIPTYQKIGYRDVYPGIDLVYYGNQGQLEYDFVVAPGADPTQIRVAFEGAERIAVDQTGDLVLTLPQSSTGADQHETATLRLQKPVVYQRDEQGEKHLLAGSYVIEPSADRAASVAVQQRTTAQVAFQVAAYDRSRPLIIDPVLSWATYLGGSGFSGDISIEGDDGTAIAVDTAGNAYVTGIAYSPDFPGTAGSAIQSTNGGPPDVFVTKLNATGTAIVYSTYLGGSNFDNVAGVAVDAAGNAYVTGGTISSNFPVTAGSAIQSTLAGGDAFVTKLNAAGTAIVYSTYLGGSSGDSGGGIAVDAAGNAYVTGHTSSPDFPGTASSAIQGTFGGWVDAFVTKLNAAGTAIVYSTYLGGSDFDGSSGIAVDTAGNAYVMGGTLSSNFPVTAGSAIQSTYGGSQDVFVTKLNAAGTAMLYSTYLGGSGFDNGFGIAVDAAGNASVTGATGSSDFPGTAGSAIQSTPDSIFVTKLNAAGTATVYSTYLGGSSLEMEPGIAVDAAGNAYVTGRTFSSDFPVTAGSAFQSTYGGNGDAFVTKLNAAGTAILYSTYLGSSSGEGGAGIAVDVAGNAYVTGTTTSSNFPGTAGSPIQSTLSGGIQAFVAKISDGASSIPFAAFGPKAEIKVRDQEFELKATFTLGSGNNGIAPLTEAVTVQVGPFMTTIPAGSFKSHKGRFKFEGLINGVQLEAELRSLILGNDYELKIEGQGADLTGITNPVTVSVTIGNDSGSKAITAKMK